MLVRISFLQKKRSTHKCGGGPFQRSFHLRASSDLAANLLNIFMVLHGRPFKVGPCSGPVVFPSQDLKELPCVPAKPSKATVVVLQDAKCVVRVSHDWSCDWGKPDPAPWRRVTLGLCRRHRWFHVDFNFGVLVLLRNRSNQRNWLLDSLPLKSRTVLGEMKLALAEGRGTEGRGSMQLQYVYFKCTWECAWEFDPVVSPVLCDEHVPA